MQRASGNAFEGSLRCRRSREQCVEDLREAGVFLGPSSHLASERLDGGGHSRSLRLPCAIETIETNTGGEVGFRGTSGKDLCYVAASTCVDASPGPRASAKTRTDSKHRTG